MAGYCKQIAVRKVFLWGIAAIYLFAFSSLYIQIPGLYGRNGIMPAKITFKEGWTNIFVVSVWNAIFLFFLFVFLFFFFLWEKKNFSIKLFVSLIISRLVDFKNNENKAL
ncbi:uncharacterized protein LOC116290869 [Actinia tenebrosa]|uniref:Uncharacterized protein LOC116290869 n=1 Tax=Actinia tenebrosa TaxID=6105 RepID=A0A6P8HBQ0_ACTTE|nr:uncharacterized protein LOC116290869 [Actinia tenebrosa]